MLFRSSSATRPEADARTWQNLPHFLSFAVLKLPPGAHRFTVEFLDARGTVLTNRTKLLEVTLAADRDNVFYLSDQSTQTPAPALSAP